MSYNPEAHKPGIAGEKTEQRPSSRTGAAAVAPGYSDITSLLATLVNNDPNIQNAPHADFWTLPYTQFMATRTDAWGVPGNLVTPGDPKASNLFLALSGAPPFDGSTLPQMPDIDSDPGGRHATADELQLVETWINNKCPE